MTRSMLIFNTMLQDEFDKEDKKEEDCKASEA